MFHGNLNYPEFHEFPSSCFLVLQETKTDNLVVNIGIKDNTDIPRNRQDENLEGWEF